MYSWSSSDDCSRDSSVTSAGAALDDLSGVAVGVLVVGVPVVFTGCVAVDDCWAEDEGWAELGWDGKTEQVWGWMLGLGWKERLGLVAGPGLAGGRQCTSSSLPGSSSSSGPCRGR